MELKKLVEEFSKNVAAQTDAINKGDARAGNKYADRYIAALQALRRMGDAGRDALAVLVEHPRADVRVGAAAFLLRYRTAQAKAVLEAAALGGGVAAINATMVLKHWAEGTWSLDPAEEAVAQPEALRPAPSNQRSRPRTERDATDRRKKNKREKPGG